MSTKIPKVVWLQLLPCLVGLGLGSYEPLLATSPEPTVPDSLKVPQGEVLLLKTSAKGVQIYQCQAKADKGSQFEWTLLAPEADLFDEKGKKIGKHYLGPTWEANDGSKVVGQVKEHANSPDNSGIPWLLLTAKSHEGNGIFSRVSSIQRVDTVGGLAPQIGCNLSSKGKQVRINYKANYYLYEPARTGSMSPL